MMLHFISSCPTSVLHFTVSVGDIVVHNDGENSLVALAILAVVVVVALLLVVAVIYLVRTKR